MDVLKQDHLRGKVLGASGGPDGIIGTQAGSRGSKISLLIFELKGSCIDPLSDLVTCSSLTYLILYIL